MQKAAEAGHKARFEIGVSASDGHWIVGLARCLQKARWLAQRADWGLRSTAGTPDAVLTGWWAVAQTGGDGPDVDLCEGRKFGVATEFRRSQVLLNIAVWMSSDLVDVECRGRCRSAVQVRNKAESRQFCLLSGVAHVVGGGRSRMVNGPRYCCMVRPSVDFDGAKGKLCRGWGEESQGVVGYGRCWCAKSVKDGGARK